MRPPPPQVRSLRKARDIREQIEGVLPLGPPTLVVRAASDARASDSLIWKLMERVELEITSNAGDTDAICKARPPPWDPKGLFMN